MNIETGLGKRELTHKSCIFNLPSFVGIFVPILRNPTGYDVRIIARIDWFSYPENSSESFLSDHSDFVLQLTTLYPHHDHILWALFEDLASCDFENLMSQKEETV